MALIYNPVYDITLEEIPEGYDHQAILTVYNRDANGLRDNLHSGFWLAVGPQQTALEVAQEAAPWAFIDETDLPGTPG